MSFFFLSVFLQLESFLFLFQTGVLVFTRNFFLFLLESLFFFSSFNLQLESFPFQTGVFFFVFTRNLFLFSLESLFFFLNVFLQLESFLFQTGVFFFVFTRNFFLFSLKSLFFFLSVFLQLESFLFQTGVFFFVFTRNFFLFLEKSLFYGLVSNGLLVKKIFRVPPSCICLTHCFFTGWTIVCFGGFVHICFYNKPLVSTRIFLATIFTCNRIIFFHNVHCGSRRTLFFLLTFVNIMLSDTLFIIYARPFFPFFLFLLESLFFFSSFNLQLESFLF